MAAQEPPAAPGHSANSFLEKDEMTLCIQGDVLEELLRLLELEEIETNTIESLSASQARGMSIGRIFSREGRLVATVAQEGLIRYHGKGA